MSGQSGNGGAGDSGAGGDAADSVGPAERIVLGAMSHDPGLDEGLARRLAAAALEYVNTGVDPQDAPELARRMLAGDSEAGASAASVVAAATADALRTDAD